MTEAPSSSELWAERAVGAATGAVVEHIDVGGVQGEVDALIRFPDGRVHALEVTSGGTSDEFEVAATIHRINWRWPTVGAWRWSVGIASMDDYRRLRKIYPRVIRLCEARGLTQPWMLPFEDLQGDPELTWAAYVAQSSIHGHPGNESEPMTYVAPAPLGGAVDESLSELSADIDTLLETESVARRVAKLRGREGVDGRELFVAVAASGVSFSVYYELLDPQALPAVPLHAAQGIDRVWIATGTSAVVSWTTAENWRLHRMPDALRAVAG